MDQANSWMGFFVKYPDLSAALVGLLLSWFATQFIKGLLPDMVPDIHYRRLVQGIGFGTGAFFAYGAWHLFDAKASAFEDIYYSIGIGVASPGLYSLVVPYLSNKFPWVEKVLSGRPNQ